MRQTVILLIAAGFFLLLSGCTGPSEPEITGPYSNDDDYTTTALETNLVQIETGGTMGTAAWVKGYLCVTNQTGSPLENLNQYNLCVVESTDAGISEIASGNLSVKSVGQTGEGTATVLVMDYSDFMPESVKGDVENAVKLFIVFMQSSDVAEIIKFSYYPEVVQPFTSNKDELTAAVDEPWGGAGGGSALVDAIYTAMLDANQRDEIKAIYAMTMGWEDSSLHTMTELQVLAESTGVPCYTFGMGEGDTLTLSEIADFSGGRFFYVPALEGSDEILELLSGMLKKMYVVEWNIQSSSGSEVHVSITTEYTCGNGTFTSTATGIFIAP